jgi:hypothetical protein
VTALDDARAALAAAQGTVTAAQKVVDDLSAAPPPPPPPPPTTGMARYGTANGWRLPQRPLADQTFELDQDTALGAKYLRIVPLPSALTKAILDRGITPVILFGGNPTYPWGTTPATLAAQAKAVATAWGEQVIYECLNEVNIHGWSADAYLSYLKAFRDAVKSVAPQALVLNAGLWTTAAMTDPHSMLNWTERFAVIGGLDFTDLYNLHLYDDPAEHGAWSTWDMAFGSGGRGFYDARNVRSLIGPSKPIVSTESGGPVPKYGETKQATIIGNALHAADGIGLADRRTAFTLIYNVLDDDVTGFGMLRPDRSKRPSFAAFQAVAKA